MLPKLLDKRTVPTSIDCIKRCPFDSDLFAAGHYRQIEGENVVGGLSILRVDGASLAKDSVFLEVPPILHLTWLDAKHPEGYLLLAACRDAHLRIVNYSPTSNSLKLLAELSVEPNTYYLYCDSQPHPAGTSIVFSTNVETVWHILLGHDLTIISSRQFRMHEYSVWTCRLSPHNGSLFASGDQLGRLNLYDIRLPEARYFTNNKSHEGGVSDIVYARTSQNTLLTATFGGVLKWIDLRKPTLHEGSYHSEGVMWRIVEDIKPSNQLLLCMSSENKYEVVVKEESPQKLYEIGGHASLAYAADWNASQILTASFYDRLLCLWSKP